MDSREGKEKRARAWCRALQGEPHDSQAKVGLAGLRLILPPVWRGSPAQCGNGWRKQEPAKNRQRKVCLSGGCAAVNPNSNTRMHQRPRRGSLLLPSNMKDAKEFQIWQFFFVNRIFFSKPCKSPPVGRLMLDFSTFIATRGRLVAGRREKKARRLTKGRRVVTLRSDLRFNSV